MLPTLLFLSLCLTAAASIIPRQDAKTCTAPEKRLEWRQLDIDNQRQYIEAVKCLKSKPSTLGLATTLYDDFPYVHAHLDQTIHSVAMFLPWHRYFVHLYEESLRECGYKGPMSYWDWTLDVADVSGSSIWDSETGFGSNGVPNESETNQWGYPRNCVPEGPFRDLRLEYEALDERNHCLTRNFNNGTNQPGDMFANAYSKEAMDRIMSQITYAEFRYELEGGPHGAIHSAIGGDMSPSTSPNGMYNFFKASQTNHFRPNFLSSSRPN
jgi:tyrosinase